MQKMGRPAKLTAQVQDTIVQAIRSGNYNEVAAQMAGVCERTLYNWLERGEEEQAGKYFQFLQAVKKAAAEAEARHLALIANAAQKTWQAAAWFLERKHPDRWGRKDRQELAPENKGKLSVEFIREIIRDSGMEE